MNGRCVSRFGNVEPSRLERLTEQLSLLAEEFHVVLEVLAVSDEQVLELNLATFVVIASP